MAHIQQLIRWREYIEKAIPSANPKVTASVWSEHAEALAAFTDGQLQQFVQLLIGVVGREAQLVKTGKIQRNKIIVISGENIIKKRLLTKYSVVQQKKCNII